MAALLRRRRRRRACAPTSNTDSHDNHEKINLVSYMGMGLRLALDQLLEIELLYY